MIQVKSRFIILFSSLLFLLSVNICNCIPTSSVQSKSKPSLVRFSTKAKMTSVLDHRKHHHDDHHHQQQQQILERDSSVNELLSPSSEAVHQGEEEQSALVTNRVSRGGGATGKELASESFSESILQTLKVGFYFGLWYALNIVYNIVNKKVLNVLPAPLIVGSIQFGIGALYVGLLWMLRLRSQPKLSGSRARLTIRTVGFWHCTGQLFSMVSLGAGPVSFTHIVKALEPFFSAIVAALYFGKWMHPVVYATLIPVVGGVGYACLKEKSFSWLAFGTAMGSNLSFALRAVLSKMAMTSSEGNSRENPLGSNLTATNMFGLVTCAAFWISIPLALLAEGQKFFKSAGTSPLPDTLEAVQLPSLWDSAVESSENGAFGLMRGIILSGLFHYLNNEVMYLALSNVHPVTLAVGNTMKRVFIMVASVMVFRNQISLQAGIGSAIGISGVLLYSLTKQYYENLEKEQTRKKNVEVKLTVQPLRKIALKR